MRDPRLPRFVGSRGPGDRESSPMSVKGIARAILLFVLPLFCLCVILVKVYWTSPEYYPLRSVLIYVYAYLAIYFAASAFCCMRPERMSFVSKFTVVSLQIILVVWSYMFALNGL